MQLPTIDIISEIKFLLFYSQAFIMVLLRSMCSKLTVLEKNMEGNDEIQRAPFIMLSNWIQFRELDSSFSGFIDLFFK
jgi:hypothetical protein